jgi:hypothetical protein
MTLEHVWIRFSEESNALDYLEKTVEFIERVEANPTDWKWVLLALHGALYGFMICSLKGTDHANVLEPKRKPPRLISFPEALRRCQESSRMLMLCHSKVLTLSDEQKQSLDYIHDIFRNSFAHYQPRLWSIEAQGMPGIVSDGLDIVLFLGTEANNYARFSTEKVKGLVNEAKARLDGLKEICK